MGKSRGCTMLAVDPTMRRVYLGSGIAYDSYHKGFVFQRILTPFHLYYSNLLLKGMVELLEANSDEEKSE